MAKKILMLSKYSPGLIDAWKQLGYEVVEDEKEKVDYVFSFNFSPTVAENCNKYHMTYISWVVDCPHGALWSQSARYSTNRIFVFDYAQWQELHEAGNAQVFYLPIHTDVKMFQSIIGADAWGKKDKYATDVAFVGNLYDSAPHNLYDQIKYLPDYTRGYLDSLMRAQYHLWGSNIVHAAITDRVWKELQRNVRLELENDYDERIYESFIEGIIHKKIAQLERKVMCSCLAQQFDFVLYSGSDTSYDEKITNKGYVDYVKEMPLVFGYSKININITLHSISTGIPLRVLDIMACGGFCLTNYQEEIATYFEDGVELVTYTDLEDMCEKIIYYLEHDEERESIARAGYEKVKSQFDYIHGVGKIVSVLEENGLSH